MKFVLRKEPYEESIFSCGVLLLAVLAGCSTADNKSTFDLAVFDDPGEQITLDGITFTLMSEWTGEIFPQYGDSVYGDNLLQRYKDAEKDLHITIEGLKNDFNFIAKVAAGTPMPDCIDAHGTDAIGWYEAGLLYPISEISTMDYTDVSKYGPMYFIQYGIYSDCKPYGFTCWGWENMPQYAGVLLFNNVMVRNAGATNPYELQENGKWSWEEFRKVLKVCDDNLSGNINNFKALFEDDNDRFAKTALFSNGIRLIVKNGSGYGTDLFTEQAYKAIEYVKSLYDEKLLEQGGVVQFVKERRSAFLYTESYQGTLFGEGDESNAAYALEEYGMMPFPYGPDGTPETVSAFVRYGRRLFWTSAFSVNETDDLGIIYEYIFAPFGNNTEYDVGWKEIAKSTIFHHQQDLDNFIYMAENVRYDYSAQLRTSYDLFDKYMPSAIFGTKAVISAFDSMSSVVKDDISKNITWMTDDIAWN